MAWDDLHEPGEQPDKPKGGGSRGPGGGPPFEVPQIKVPKFKPQAVFLVVVVLLLAWILPSVIYTVEQDAEGVVTRFGKYHRTTDPGLHVKFPSPFEIVYKPQIQATRIAEIGYRKTQGGQTRDFPHESRMLTKHLNIVDIDLVVQYNIKDGKNYLFVVRDQEKIVRNVAETVIRGIIGNDVIDKPLTTGKEEIHNLVEKQMQELLDKYQSGINITAIQIQRADPPAQVTHAFKDVTSAKEDKERMINEAEGYRNAIIPEARGQSAQIEREAEAYREQTVKKAQGEASRFLAQYEEYKKAPEITRKRIYLETMEEIYPNVQKFVMGKQGSGVLPILPLGQNQSFPLPTQMKSRSNEGK